MTPPPSTSGPFDQESDVRKLKRRFSERNGVRHLLSSFYRHGGARPLQFIDT